mgnify:CR=1 FL=1
MLEKFIYRSKEVTEKEKKLLEEVKKINHVTILKLAYKKRRKRLIELKVNNENEL